MARRVVVLELNELCPPLIDRFMASGDLPNFARLRSRSRSSSRALTSRSPSSTRGSSG